MVFLAAAGKSEFCLADIENIIADIIADMEDAFSILASPAGLNLAVQSKTFTVGAINSVFEQLGSCQVGFRSASRLHKSHPRSWGCPNLLRLHRLVHPSLGSGGWLC
jgi:hypothetical protein